MTAHARHPRSMHGSWPWVAAIAVVALMPAHAQDRDTPRMGMPVDFDQLQDLRGGFDLPSGLQASFGFERVVYVNGELVATTRVSIPDLRAITPEQAQSLADATQSTRVQVGEGNTYSAASSMNGGLVIQNTRDGQAIDVLTTLDVGVDTLDQFKALNAQNALHDALIVVPGAP